MRNVLQEVCASDSRYRGRGFRRGARYIVFGGSSAREQPPALESIVARKLLNRAVPQQAKGLQNPLSAGANVSPAQAFFVQKCALCHGYYGSGKTEIGAGQYPHPPDLRKSEVQKMADGELFHIVRNGIRYTGMPGWQMPDEQIWHLVVFIRSLPNRTP